MHPRICWKWQGQRGSNPRPAVLETAALPTELYPFAPRGRQALPKDFRRVCKDALRRIPQASATFAATGGKPGGARRQIWASACAPSSRRAAEAALSVVPMSALYSVMAATMPAPTVRPPSRMAKRRRSSMAIGTISSTSIVTLSPGITISVPSGSVTTPVTSVVRK